MASLAVETTTQAELAAAVSGLLGEEVAALSLHARGRNSRVYQARTPSGRQYAVKVSAPQPGEARNRTAAEWSALTFLWAQGIRMIPEPVAADPQRGCVVVAFIEGRRVDPGQVTERQVDELTDFLMALKALGSRPDAAELPDASEACFSLQEIVINLEQRLERLMRAAGPREAPLRAFLRQAFLPARDRLCRWVLEEAAAQGLHQATTLAAARRTLSPSDAGFHNALLTAEGRLVFVDFEHFGWDDPAKMVVDLVWHPQMTLAEPMQRRMLQRLFEGFADDPSLRARARLVFPLFGLKWCLILLNEFVPADQHRRAFAQAEDVAWTGLQEAQLAKAQRLLARVTASEFPDGR